MRISGRSRAGVLVCLFCFQFDFAFRSYEMASFELAAGFDLASLPKERNVTSPMFFPKTTVPCNLLKCCMEINYPKNKMLKVCYTHVTRFRVKQFIHTKEHG